MQSDVITNLEKMKEGLDVNIFFDRVDHYEFTEEMAIFDVLKVSLMIRI